jgi:hypothetical protein
MSSAGTRERSLPIYGPTSLTFNPKLYGFVKAVDGVVAAGKQITVSESHAMSRKDGSYRAGGPFFTSRTTPFIKCGSVKEAYSLTSNRFYSGPVVGDPPTLAEMNSIGYKNTGHKFGDKNESQMKTDGTNAIAYSAPINPASDLGTSMAEVMREGIPSIPGIQSWKRRTEILKGLGSEYLNYIFGWAPLAKEVTEVRDAARNHRDIMKQYHAGEGKDTHRTFEYPLQRSVSSIATNEYPSFPGAQWHYLAKGNPRREISLVRETKRWFEGCFTYALPSQADTWRKSIGFGSQADQLFGIRLTPDILWELTPWSWAVDWFTNAGENITNISNFGAAGLVMRYGYMMEESIERVTATGDPAYYFSTPVKNPTEKYYGVWSSSWSRGYETVTKRRIPASPFGFSIGWEGLSPTQLAITAALGITKLL